MTRLFQQPLKPALLALAILAGTVWAQAPRIRTSAEEVLVDFVVRDKHGRLVRDLKPGDVEVFEDGAPRPMRSFRLVRTHEAGAAAKGPAPAGAPAGMAVRAGGARNLRAVSLVFDRLGGADGRRLAVHAAREFLDADNDPSTWVGLFLLDARLRVFEPYTNDRARLRSRLDRIASGGDALFRAVSDPYQSQLRNAVGRGGPSGTVLGGGVRDSSPTTGMQGMTEAIRHSGLRDEPAEGSSFGLPGTAETPMPSPLLQMLAKTLDYESRVVPVSLDRSNLYSLLALVRAQASLPGRKTMLLMSEGLRIPLSFRYALRTAVSEANRGNVSIYTLDVRGLSSQGMTFEGANDLATATASSAAMIVNVWENDFRVFERAEASLTAGSQAAMRELAEGTGGFLIANTNDVRGPIRKMVEETGTQYELTYVPALAARDGRFHTIEVRTRRAGARVQARKGYFALPEIEGQTLFPFELPLLEAIEATPPPRPFEFYVAAFRFRPGARVAEALVAFELPRETLTLAPQPSGAGRTRAAFLALVRNAGGEVVRKISRDLAFAVPAERREAFRRGNLIFVQPLRLAPGRYHLDAAVLDGEGRRVSVGSEEVTLEPAAGLAVSDLVLARQVEHLEQPEEAGDPLAFEDKVVTPAVSALFRRGVNPELSLFCVVYPDPGLAEPPRLSVEFFRAGRPVSRLASTLEPAPGGAIPYLARFSTGEFPPGRYDARVRVEQGGSAAERRVSFVVGL